MFHALLSRSSSTFGDSVPNQKSLGHLKNGWFMSVEMFSNSYEPAGLSSYPDSLVRQATFRITCALKLNFRTQTPKRRFLRTLPANLEEPSNPSRNVRVLKFKQHLLQHLCANVCEDECRLHLVGQACWSTWTCFRVRC